MAEKELVILTITGAFIIGHILFLALYLWMKGRNWLPQRLLSFLLFCLAIRVVKSVLLLAFPGFAFANMLIALGVIGMSAAGPLIYLYSRCVVRGPFTLNPGLIIHFLPALLLSFTAFFLPDNLMFHVYQVTVYLIFLYVLASMRKVMRAGRINQSFPGKTWMYEYLAACLLMTIIFAIQLYTRNRYVYITVSISSAVILYVISLRAVFNKAFDQAAAKPKKKSKDPGLFQQLSKTLSEKKLYLDPLLTVHKLSQAIQIPAHVISALINEQAQTGFSEYINEYRVREAAKKLTSAEWSHFTIEAIAYDSGFNSLSAFYNSFKKVKKMSPAKFRRENSS